MRGAVKPPPFRPQSKVAADFGCACKTGERAACRVVKKAKKMGPVQLNRPLCIKAIKWVYLLYLSAA